MAFSIIKIKRSATQSTPTRLFPGELAYSSVDSSERLFIGVGDSTDDSGYALRIATIGGERFTRLTPENDSAGISFANRLVRLGDSRNLDYLRITSEFVVPVDSTAARPIIDQIGSIRYNTTDQSFEGYDGIAWAGLGGVKDVDQDTFIIAETSPGDDNDDLRFFTAASQRLEINSEGQIVAAPTYIPDSDYSLTTKVYVDNVKAGTPLDGLWNDGAYMHFADSNRVTDVLDGLNEALNNVRNNVFVRDLTFAAQPSAAGSGFTATLNVTNDGNPNRYDINWGDGFIDSNVPISPAPTHVYTNSLLSPVTVTVRAYNTNAYGTGSEATKTNIDHVIIYTPDPVVDYNLFRTAQGGIALTEADLYVIENQPLYLANETLNTLVSDKNGPAIISYKMNWGDGIIDNIANDDVDGGVSGNRLQHIIAAGSSSGTGLATMTLTLDSHTTADPTLIPMDHAKGVKIYDPNIAPPNGLSTKTISNPSSTGQNPKLPVAFTDNTNGASLTPGSDVVRVTPSSGNIRSSITSPGIAYSAQSGEISAKVNDVVDGSVPFAPGSNQSGTYNSLVVEEEQDYNLFDANGNGTTFIQSIYHPDLYTGFRARISQNVSTLPSGLNSYQLSHTETGDTNKLEFVRDPLENTPTMSSGNLVQTNLGTPKYVSGIPHYTDDGTLQLQGLSVTNWIGETYRDTNQVLRVSGGTNFEGTTQSSVGNQTYTYAQIDGSTSYLTSGIPNANTGFPAQYSLGNIDININSSNVKCVERITTQMFNVNGGGNTLENSTRVQVYSANQAPISEIGISVDDNLGEGYNDDGIRIFDLSSLNINTPSYSNTVNFYTNNVYSESADPGVQGTQEASVRFGSITHDTTNYSVGYLPVGPDRSADTGTQYFTFAFRRTVVANFDINITSTTGVEAIFIAAPGTSIDNTSTLNGWLDCSVQYNGAGVPGVDVGSGGNGSNGCASTGADKIISNTPLSGSYRMTLGTENLTNARNNVALVRIALSAGQQITALSIS